MPLGEDSTRGSGVDRLEDDLPIISGRFEGPEDSLLREIWEEVRTAMWNVIHENAHSGRPIVDVGVMAEVEHLIDGVIVVPGDFEMELNEDGPTPYLVFPSVASPAVAAIPFEDFLLARLGGDYSTTKGYDGDLNLDDIY